MRGRVVIAVSWRCRLRSSNSKAQALPRRSASSTDDSSNGRGAELCVEAVYDHGRKVRSSANYVLVSIRVSVRRLVCVVVAEVVLLRVRALELWEGAGVCRWRVGPAIPYAMSATFSLDTMISANEYTRGKLTLLSPSCCQ
eukprot:3514909-Rhodomonas_salina.2